MPCKQGRTTDSRYRLINSYDLYEGKANDHSEFPLAAIAWILLILQKSWIDVCLEVQDGIHRYWVLKVAGTAAPFALYNVLKFVSKLWSPRS